MDSQFPLAPNLIQHARRGAGVPVWCEAVSFRPATQTRLAFLARCTHKHQTSADDSVDRLKNEIEALQKQLIQQKAQDTRQITVLRTAAAVFAHESPIPKCGVYERATSSNGD
jgi:hypothetical protein